jgi:hypothetical protein
MQQMDLRPIEKLTLWLKQTSVRCLSEALVPQ